jgi:GxxExxY protein
VNTSTAWIEGPLSKQALSAFHVVYGGLGFGFLEGGYANALAVELRYRGLVVEREVLTELVYRGVPVGTYRMDLVVNGRLLIEVKAINALTEADDRQLLNYLRCSRLEVGFLFNFGPRPQFRRKIFTNDRK